MKDLISIGGLTDCHTSLHTLCTRAHLPFTWHPKRNAPVLLRSNGKIRWKKIWYVVAGSHYLDDYLTLQNIYFSRQTKFVSQVENDKHNFERVSTKLLPTSDRNMLPIENYYVLDHETKPYCDFETTRSKPLSILKLQVAFYSYHNNTRRYFSTSWNDSLLWIFPGWTHHSQTGWF